MIPSFSKKFKALYDKADVRLFHNSNLCFNIVDEMASQESMKDFMVDVANIPVDSSPSSTHEVASLNLRNSKFAGSSLDNYEAN